MKDERVLTDQQKTVLEKLEKAMPNLTDFQLGQIDMLAQLMGGDTKCHQ